MENDDGVWNCLPEDGFDEDPFLATLSNICPDGWRHENSPKALPRRSLSEPNLLNQIGEDNRTCLTQEYASLTQDEIPLSSNKTGKNLPDKLCDEFFGVYCLISRSSNKYYKNRCYIGYTVDPNRRIRQHNAGTQFGGASRTDHRGPWDMVLIIYGFPNSVSALRFEWAWQNPDKSRRLRPLELKKSQKETAFAFRLRIVCCMLNTEPWKRLSLTLRWLMPECEIPFSHRLPEHIAIEHGVIKKSWIMVKESMENAKAICNCVICEQKIISLTELLRCVECSSHFHMECLAKTVLKKNGEYNNFLFPVGGSCPVCFAKFLWGNMIRDQRAVLALINSSSGDKLLTEVPVGKLVRT